MNQPVLVIAVDDLIFLSKILAAAREKGVSAEKVQSASEMEQMLQGRTSVLIVDLNADGFSALEMIEAARNLRADTKIVGFVSHMQVDLIQRAEKLGCDLVLSKSRFVAELPSLLSGR